MAKSSWDTLVLGGTVLSMEPNSNPLVNGAVAITDHRIAAVGPAEDLLEHSPASEIVNAAGCLILPGFVNTHSHLAMTLLRGLADDLPLKTWLEDHIWPAEQAHMNRETVALGTRLAAAEQLLAGITTTTDMYFFGDVVAEALIEAGMRGVVAESLIDFATPRCFGPDEMIEKQLELIAEYRNHPLIVPAVAAHSPYSVCATNLVQEAEIAEDHGVPMQIHLSETRWEVEKLLNEKGMSPVAYLADLGVLSERTVAAHCVHVSPKDIELLAEFEVGVSHNPTSNLKLSSGISPVPAMLEAGVTVGLGTDGTASNNTLDLLRDMQLAALVHKGVSGDPTVLPARALIEMITTTGARVLGIDHRVGQLKEGMEADIICVANENPNGFPIYDAMSHLAYAARSCDVLHVLVAGQPVVRDRQLLTLDVEQLRSQTIEVADRIRGG